MDDKCDISLINLGAIEAESLNIQTAFKLFNKAKSLNQNNYKIYHNIGNCLAKEGNIKEALKFFREAVRLQPKNLNTLKMYLLTNAKLANWDDVEKVCKTILKLDKKDAIAISLLTRSMNGKQEHRRLNNFLLKIQKKLENLERQMNASNNHEKLKNKIKNVKKKLSEKLTLNKRISMRGNKNDDYYYEMNTNIDNYNHEIPKDLEGFLENTYKEPKDYLQILKSDSYNKDVIFDLAMSYYTRLEYSNAENLFLRLIEIDQRYKSDITFEKLGDIHLKSNRPTETALLYYQKSLKITPKALLHVKIGRCYEQLGNLGNAIDEYNYSIVLDPNFVWGIFHLGCIYSKLNNKDALIFLKRAYEKGKEDPEIISKYCDELIKKGDDKNISEAIEILEKAEKSFPQNVEIIISLAKGYAKQNNFKSAVELLEQANSYSNFYSSPNRLFILALFSERSKNFSRAIEIYKNILAINKEHIDSQLHLAFILLNSREFKRAFKYFKYALKINPNLSHVHFGLGRIYHHMKNYEEAIDHYSQCISNDNDNYRAFYRIGLIYFETYNLLKAKEMFQKSIEINPKYVNGIVGLANVFYEEVDYNKAQELNLEAYKIDNEDLQALVGLANCYAANQKFKDSIKFYKKALQLDDSIPDIHFSLGNSYYLIEKYQEAIFHYVKTLKLDKNFKSEIYLNLGNALSACLRYQEAIKSYKKYIKSNVSNPEVYFNLGNSYYLTHNYKKATSNYEECLNRNYSVDEVKLALCRVYLESDNMKCIEFTQKLLKDDPNDTRYLLYYALSCENVDEIEESKKIYKVILFSLFINFIRKFYK